MNKIIVTGLPRSGSMSVAEALTILGYNTIHHCPIRNPGTEHLLSEDTYDAYVSCNYLFTPFCTSNKWILLHRDDWESAIRKIDENFDRWLDHTIVYYKKRKLEQENLLHYNVNQGWEPLCSFLNKPVPNVDFPHLNKA